MLAVEFLLQINSADILTTFGVVLTMSSSPASTLRQRTGKEKQKINGKADSLEKDINEVLKKAAQKAPRETPYIVALGVITLLAFITRFIGISHPDEVVFDEVHFGKV